MLYEEIKKNKTHIPEGVRKIYEAVIKDDRSLVINDLSVDNNLVPDGSLLIDNVSYKMKVKKNGEFDFIDPLDIFNQEAIEGSVIKKNSVNGNRIQQYSITRDRIQQESLTSNEIENASIIGSKIKSDTIEDKHMKQNSIGTSQLKNESVNADKIKNDSIKSEHIKNYAIGGNHIKNAAVETDHIEASAITSEKIKNASVKENHIQENNITSKLIGSSQVISRHLSNSCVQENHLKDNCVTSQKIQSESVNPDHLGAHSVTHEKISLEAVDFKNLKVNVNNFLNTCVVVKEDIATAPAFRALNQMFTKILSVSDNAYFKDVRAYGNVDIDGKLHAKGDISTDGRVYRATFNDLAEAYIPGEELKPGEIVAIHEDGKVYKSDIVNDMIVGVVSDCYADCYGASINEIESGEKVAIGLIGKVPVKVIGPIKLGQYIVPSYSGIGYGASGPNAKEYAIGKALESKTCDGVKRVLCLIFPH